MSNIESLTSVIQHLESSVKFWNNFRYIVVGTTAFFTVLSFLAFWISGNKTDLLSKAKDELSKIRSEEQARQIIKANESIEIAKAQAAQANEKAESERLARVKLEARLADRILIPEQQARLISILKPFGGVVVDVVLFGDTPEIRTIGTDLHKCLLGAGWNAHMGSAFGGMGKGIHIGVRMPTDIKTSNAAETLITELRSMGIVSGPCDFDKMEDPKISSGDLQMNTPMKIFIGSKP